jgi:hypothetical protein
MLLALGLNLWGNSWGTPDKWHPDEIDDEAQGLVTHKTLNPHFFAYGGLHYYVLAATAALPVDVYSLAFDRKPPEASGNAIAQWRDRKNARVKIVARGVSAVMGALLVYFTWLIGDLLFGGWVGPLAALFLAVCPYLVEIAHFSTVDMAANFWFWLACLCSVLLWKKGTGLWYALAAFAGGLAVGVKVDRLFVVLPMLMAHFIRDDRRGLEFRRIVGYGLLLPVGYVVANPTLMFALFEFVDGTSRELYFNILRGSGQTSFLSMLIDMRVGMGLPLFAASLASLAYLLYEFARGRHRREIGWLLSIVVPYYLVFGSRFSLPWYSPFFYPAFSIIAAYGCASAVRGLRQRFATGGAVAAGVLVVAIAGFSLAKCVAVDLQFVNDGRYLAARWIEKNIPAGALIEVGRRGPQLMAGRYQVIRRSNTPKEYYEQFRTWRNDLEGYQPYRSMRQTIFEFEQTVRARLALKPRMPYQAWFDKTVSKKLVGNNTNNENVTAQYRVFVDYLDFSLIKSLQEPASGYRLLTQAHYEAPLHLGEPFPFVNPTVYVFQRQ